MKKKKSSILVTGAAGFIGSRVSELLLARGCHVVGVDNLNDAYDVRLKYWRLDRLKKNKAFEFHRVDICDGVSLKGLAQAQDGSQFEAVINLAARAGVRPSVADPALYYDTNLYGTLNLLELCRQFGIEKFILSSTSSLYGKHNPMPFREDADTSRPLSPYAASKKAAETLCFTYHYLHHLDVTVFRYFTVYGPGGRPDMSLFRFVQRISEGRTLTVFGDGTQSRDFTYVDDIAKGTVAGLKPLGFQTINLGSDSPLVLGSAIELIEKLTGKSARINRCPPHPADVPASWADISRAREYLDWEPQTMYEQGLENMVQWYGQNREWAQEICTD